MSRPDERPSPPKEHLALRFIPQFNSHRLVSRTSQKERLRLSSKQEHFVKKSLNSDGHLITEDSVFPTTAPGGAPKRNRCYQDARYFIYSPPCARCVRALGAPRTAHFATPPLGAGAVWLLLSLAALRIRHCLVARFVRPRRRGV